MDVTSLAGRVALVTGGATGIGRAIGVELAARGARVMIHCHRSRAEADQTAAQLVAHGHDALVTSGDLTTKADVDRVVADTVQRLGGIDILVNNAGDLIERRPLVEMSEAVWHRVQDVNVTSAFLCSQAVAGAMIARRAGAIVNLSSLAAHNGGGPGAFAYATAKAAVIGFTKGIAKELAPHGIRVNAVAPGLIGETGFHRRFTAPEAFAAAAKGIAIGRAGTPEDVARVVGFLVSDAGAFVVGETIEINGGAWFR